MCTLYIFETEDIKLNAFHLQVLQHINKTCQSITQRFILYTIKIVYCEGDMFRPLLGHPILQRST